MSMDRSRSLSPSHRATESTWRFYKKPSAESVRRILAQCWSIRVRAVAFGKGTEALRSTRAKCSRSRSTIMVSGGWRSQGRRRQASMAAVRTELGALHPPGQPHRPACRYMRAVRIRRDRTRKRCSKISLLEAAKYWRSSKVEVALGGIPFGIIMV